MEQNTSSNSNPNIGVDFSNLSLPAKAGLGLGTLLCVGGLVGCNGGSFVLGLAAGGGVIAYEKIQVSKKEERILPLTTHTSSEKSTPPSPPQLLEPENKEKTPRGPRAIEALVPGIVIGGKYRIESKLGEGGFGATYIVSDESKNIKNTYVAKLQKLTGNPVEDAELIDRFEREAAALQQVGSGHGQIPTLFDYFDEQGNFFLIQEQVKGRSLMSIFIDMARQGHLMSNAYVVKLTMEILEVVQHLHNQGMIHRDIKPENIILREGDGKPILIDFGLIKQMEAGQEFQTGTMAGTPGYMPIEQQMGKALFQSDLFAVGMVFLLLTTGRPPHTLDFNEAMKYDLDWAEEYLGEALLNWLKEAIAPLPQNRFGSAEEMRQALIDIRDHALMVEGFAKAVDMMREGKDFSDSEKQGRSTNVDLEAIQKTGNLREIPSQLGEIVTTQKELDAFNALKRVLERAGRDSNLLEMHDQPDFCDIHYCQHQDQVIARLYFNDEDNLSFAVVKANGSENHYPLNTLRGIAPKSKEIIARLDEIEATLGIISYGERESSSDADNAGYVPDNDEDLLAQEVRPAIVQQLTQMYGPDFALLSIQVEDEPFRIYGQFAGQGAQAHRIFDYEVKHGQNGKLGMTYRLNPDCLAKEQAADAEQQQKDDKLAKQGIYTVDWLQRNFDSFAAAKEHFGVRAKSWQKLADAISQQS